VEVPAETFNYFKFCILNVELENINLHATFKIQNSK
jgi:hypothetical protein